MTDRDRDERGRPRSNRPRDEAGRPLDRAASRDEAISAPPARSATEALDAAERLLAEQRPFSAHEVLEDAWKRAQADERDFWQGLAQIAVGLTHAQRGNATGAVTLLRRGGARLAPYADRNPHSVDIAGVVRRSGELAATIERGGLSAVKSLYVTFRGL